MSPHTKPTQSSQILAHIVRHGSITPRDAIEHYQCFRLAARIQKLMERPRFNQRELRTWAEANPHMRPETRAVAFLK